MSKLYEKYLLLKEKDNSKLYIFKSGIFYIFLQDDARKISQVFNLKLTNLNESVVKCGFPVNNLNKYLDLFNNMGYNIQIVDSTDSKPCSTKNYLLNADIKALISNLSNINIDKLSISEAFSLIDNTVSKAKKIEKEMES